MEALWESSPKEMGINDLSDISFNMARGKKGAQDQISFGGDNNKNGGQVRKDGGNQHKSFMVTLEQGKSKKTRNL